MAKRSFPTWLVAGSLVVVTIAVYWPVTDHDFVTYDDYTYVIDNTHVTSGLTWGNALWAFRNGYAANWHPITWLSHMLDCQLFGLNAGGHHMTSMLLHALNAGLVFALLHRMTGAMWRSLLVAALFALHPLRVESVAWVSERKDVLSGFFGLLSLIAYARYANCRMQKPVTPNTQHTTRNTFHVSRFTFHSCTFYLLSLFLFALSLMSKPMLVTLPFAMLLLDYWPLGRMQSREAADTSTFRCATEDGHYATCNTQHATPLTFHVCLLLEKLPFFALSTILSALTFVVQQRGGAMNETEHLPLGARSGNALISYGRYVGKQFWPTDLAVFYPHPGYWPLTKVLLAGGLILGFSVMVWVQRQRFPYLLVGWLWFVGMLVPVIGLVHVGQQQAMADRYTYLPSLGVAAFAIWGAYEFSRRCHCLMVAVSVTGGAAIVLCLMLTRQQLGYWQDGETLFRHALAVTKNNWLAHNNLGSALDRKGKNDEALSQFQEVLHLKPHDAQAHYNLGLALYRNGQLDEAVRHYQEAIHLKPDYADAYYNLGLASYQRGRTGEALGQFQEALRLKPNNPEVHNNLGLVLLGNGKLDAAITQFQEAVQLEPRYATAHNNLGIALAKKGQTDEAIIQFQEALRLKPTYAEAHKNLGYLWTQYSKAAMASTLDGQGQYAEAIRFYQAALKVQPDQEGVLNNLAWLLATCPEAAVRNGPEAVRLATRACELTVYGKPMLIGTLAAAQAEAGDFQAAIATAERAAALATSLHLDDVAAKNRELIQLYRQGQPYHEKRETTTDPLRRRDSAASGPGAAKP